MSCYGSKPPEFLRLQPNGQIPVAVIDGRVLGSSNSILAELESSFPGHKSLAPTDRDRAQRLFRLEQQLSGAWLGWLRSSGGGGGKEFMEDTLAAVDQELQEAGGPFFMGADVTMVDVQFLSFLERACASLLYFKGFMIRVPPGTATPYPAINRWFEALEQRPSYQVTKSDYYTHAWDLPPQLGGCGAEPAGEQYRKMINGEGASWQLPLEPHGGGVEPDWGSWAHGDDGGAGRPKRPARRRGGGGDRRRASRRRHEDAGGRRRGGYQGAGRRRAGGRGRRGRLRAGAGRERRVPPRPRRRPPRHAAARRASAPGASQLGHRYHRKRAPFVGRSGRTNRGGASPAAGWASPY